MKHNMDFKRELTFDKFISSFVVILALLVALSHSGYNIMMINPSMYSLYQFAFAR